MTTSALDPRAVSALLQSAGAMIRAELSALPDAALVLHPAPGQWCVKEVLGHLIESEGRESGAWRGEVQAGQKK